MLTPDPIRDRTSPLPSLHFKTGAVTSWIRREINASPRTIGKIHAVKRGLVILVSIHRTNSRPSSGPRHKSFPKNHLHPAVVTCTSVNRAQAKT